MEMEKSGCSGDSTEADRGLVHHPPPPPRTHPKDAGQVPGLGVDNIPGQDRRGRELGVPGRFMEQVSGRMAPAAPLTHTSPAPNYHLAPTSDPVPAGGPRWPG